MAPETSLAPPWAGVLGCACLLGLFHSQAPRSPHPHSGQHLQATQSHPSRRVCRAHSLRPRLSRLHPSACLALPPCFWRVGLSTETRLGQSLLKAPRRHHQQAHRRPLLSCDQGHQPQVDALFLKRPLHFLRSKTSFPIPRTSFVPWKETYSVIAPTIGAVGKFFRPLSKWRGSGFQNERVTSFGLLQSIWQNLSHTPVWAPQDDNQPQFKH